MTNKVWSVGMMSGTSLDGIDVAAIETDGHTVSQRLPGKMYPYPPQFQDQLQNLLGTTEKTEFSQNIEAQLTAFHAQAYLDYLQTIPCTVNIVGFHGHTITHQPPSRYKSALTWQIGDGHALAKAIKTPVVYDMRQNDLQHGGEGAPLVPIYQKALAKDLTQPLAIINIGGISNVAYIDGDTLIAFDMGPGNALLDQWMIGHTADRYDAGGATAAQGQVDKHVLAQFEEHAFFKQKAPKSLDRLDYNLNQVRHLSLYDGAATLVEMTAVAIEKGFNLFPQRPQQCLITGGGRLNKTLMNRLCDRLNPTSVSTAESVGWTGDFLEAEAWAYLAVRSKYGLPLTFPTTTGVSVPLSGGQLCTPTSMK